MQAFVTQEKHCSRRITGWAAQFLVFFSHHLGEEIKVSKLQWLVTGFILKNCVFLLVNERFPIMFFYKHTLNVLATLSFPPKEAVTEICLCHDENKICIHSVCLCSSTACLRQEKGPLPQPLSTLWSQQTGTFRLTQTPNNFTVFLFLTQWPFFGNASITSISQKCSFGKPFNVWPSVCSLAHWLKKLQYSSVLGVLVYFQH